MSKAIRTFVMGAAHWLGPAEARDVTPVEDRLLHRRETRRRSHAHRSHRSPRIHVDRSSAHLVRRARGR